MKSLIRTTTLLVASCLTSPLMADPAQDKAAYELATAADWKEVFSDPCTADWRERWFLDGEVGTVVTSPEGMANPHFPALQSAPMALSGASRRKQTPSSDRQSDEDGRNDLAQNVRLKSCHGDRARYAREEGEAETEAQIPLAMAMGDVGWEVQGEIPAVGVRSAFLMKSIAPCFSMLLLASMTHGEVAVSKVCFPHMVLPRGMDVPVYGTAVPGEKGEVRFRTQSNMQISGRPAGATAPDGFLVVS